MNKMWEFIEREDEGRYGHRMGKRTSEHELEKAYECGYEDGYREAMKKLLIIMVSVVVTAKDAGDINHESKTGFEKCLS
jgi:hypothetical protein